MLSNDSTPKHFAKVILIYRWLSNGSTLKHFAKVILIYRLLFKWYSEYITDLVLKQIWVYNRSHNDIRTQCGGATIM